MSKKLAMFLLLILIGCTVNLEISVESGSLRDGSIIESEMEKEETEPKVDVSPNLSGV